jgi:DNA-binding response OmpR family regulator
MHVSDEKSFKVLVATENQVYRNNLGAKLRFEGFSVEYAEGGFHLLHLLERNDAYNLIIIHENMSDMSAYEIMSLVRNNFTKAQIPILYISKNKPSEDDVCEMIFVGANELLLQNANFAPLIERIKKYFTLAKNAS